jgi:hypothetical protein
MPRLPPLPGWEDRARAFVRARSSLLAQLLGPIFAPRPPPEWTAGMGHRCARCGLAYGLGDGVDGFDALVPACYDCADEVLRVEAGKPPPPPRTP